jgi:hypothetical protein
MNLKAKIGIGIMLLSVIVSTGWGENTYSCAMGPSGTTAYVCKDKQWVYVSDSSALVDQNNYTISVQDSNCGPQGDLYMYQPSNNVCFKPTDPPSSHPQIIFDVKPAGAVILSHNNSCAMGPGNTTAYVCEGGKWVWVSAVGSWTGTIPAADSNCTQQGDLVMYPPTAAGCFQLGRNGFTLIPDSTIDIQAEQRKVKAYEKTDKLSLTGRSLTSDDREHLPR